MREPLTGVSGPYPANEGTKVLSPRVADIGGHGQQPFRRQALAECRYVGAAVGDRANDEFGIGKAFIARNFGADKAAALGSVALVSVMGVVINVVTRLPVGHS